MIGGAKGIGLGLDFGIGNQSRPKSSGKYLDAAVKEALCGVWIADQNTNDSPNRSIIKNKISNKGGDFEILNAAYKLNSGYGKYEVDYTAYALNNLYNVYTKINHNTIIGYNPTDIAQSYAFVYTNYYQENIDEYYIVIENLVGTISYRYIDKTGNLLILKIETNGKHLLPRSYNSLSTTNQWVGYTIDPNSSASITQIPDYQGAFVTDGVDDLIVSQKKSLEIVGENQPYTVVSMIGFIGGTQSYFNNAVGATKMNKNRIVTNNTTTGIFGYTANSVGATTKVIKNILGDKDNYNSTDEGATAPVDRRFSVEGYIRDGVIMNVAEIAWYWTFIIAKIATTDEINQVIAHYNLDKHVTPDVYYNVKKQGITNDNHSQFGDKLIDYSGNGKDMQLYNFGWEGMSGSNGYPVIIGKNKTWKEANTTQGVFSSNRIHITNQNNSKAVLFTYIINGGVYVEENNKEIPSFKVRITGITNKYILYYRYIKEDGELNIDYTITSDGEYVFPKSYLLGNTTGTSVWIGFHVRTVNSNITNPSDIFIEVLPEYENAIITDGVEDYGKVEGLPIYTDYTIVAERAWIELTSNNGSLIGKSYSNSNGAFIVEQSFDSNTDWGTTYSFGQANGVAISNIKEKGFIVQSKHKYGLKKVTDIVAGTNIDNTDIMTFATVRPKDIRFSKLALWNLMLFPYSLSEFLIERQLKKRKAGTLYEGMIEFRPKISSNIPYKAIVIYQDTNLLYGNGNDKTGTYIQKDIPIRIHVNPGDLNVPSSITVNGVTVTNLKLNSNNQYWAEFDVTKNIQKIDITIDEYIRFEDIVQPYPMFFEFIDENGNLLSWGGKARIGSTITRTKGVNYANLLEDMYDITAPKLNGIALSTLEHTVSRDMVFSCVPIWKLDNNPPKVILSPERLRLSNETYKLLGYIPDLSGNKNHGVLNNFAYKDMSGADGYVEDFSAWNKYPFAKVTYNKITISGSPDANWILYTTSGAVIDPYSIKVSGIPSDGELVYKINNVNTVLVNGINKLDGATITAASGFYITKHGDTNWRGLVIEQVGKYEGSVTFDGVDDFVSIPTIKDGDDNKQVLMTIERANNSSLLYDQNGRLRVAATDTDSEGNACVAYNGRGMVVTYINGVLNTTKNSFGLMNIKHSLITNSASVNGSQSPVIGKSVFDASFSKIGLYTFALFGEVGTDDNILKLNEIVGIEVKPETNNE